MLFMNEYEVNIAAERYASHPVLAKATRFLKYFVAEVNAHSDGWPYWRSPVNSAAKLITMIQHPETASEANYAKAMTPIKSFLTRKGYAAGMSFSALLNKE